MFWLGWVDISLQFWLAFPWWLMIFKITFMLVIYLLFQQCLFSSIFCLQILFLLCCLCCFYILDIDPFLDAYFADTVLCWQNPTVHLCCVVIPKTKCLHWYSTAFHYVFFSAFIFRNLKHFRCFLYFVIGRGPFPSVCFGCLCQSLICVRQDLLWVSSVPLACVLGFMQCQAAVAVTGLRSGTLPALFFLLSCLG